jgi:glycosyltransferase involved in cell wall biosynthesis
MSAPELSVIVCTHNPRREYLARTLAGLAAQDCARPRWELVLVDNRSEPALAGSVDLTFQPAARLVREEQLGLVHARRRGIRETSGEILLFVDDDNVLAPDYLSRALEIDRAWPQLGTWGGQAFPEWEERPAEWTQPYWSWIAVREFERDLWSNVPNETAATPFGAGMCLRRRVAETYAANLDTSPLRRSLGRSGTQLAGSEDADLALTSCDLGLGNGLFARLKLTHLISKQRVQESYLLRLVESLTCSHAIMLHARGIRPTRPSRAQRLLQAYQSLFIDARARRFDRARRRGREMAQVEIARLEALQRSGPP